MNISLIGATIHGHLNQNGIHVISFTPESSLAEEVMARLARREPTVKVVVHVQGDHFRTGSFFLLESDDADVNRQGSPQLGTKALVFRRLPADKNYSLLIKE